MLCLLDTLDMDFYKAKLSIIVGYTWIEITYKEKECKTCGGTGEIHSHNRICFTCFGSGKLTQRIPNLYNTKEEIE